MLVHPDFEKAERTPLFSLRPIECRISRSHQGVLVYAVLRVHSNSYRSADLNAIVMQCERLRQDLDDLRGDRGSVGWLINGGEYDKLIAANARERVRAP